MGGVLDVEIQVVGVVVCVVAHEENTVHESQFYSCLG